MSRVRYVCLSDLHFGAENSIMTSLVPRTTRVDSHTPSPVLAGLIECLADLVAHNEDSRKPTLVLCGDILELALANDNVAAMVFSDFIRRSFGPGNQLFDDVIFFVPGNHDHHLWESAREHQYVDYVKTRPLTQDLEIPWHTTRMRAEQDPQPVASELLTTLIRRQLPDSTVTVRAVYPNLGLSTDDGSRCVVFHHGHFVEAMYTLMSTVKDMLFPQQIAPRRIWDLEDENFAWIDFFWSTLGRSGGVGTDVGFIYDTLQSPKAMKPLLTNLARGVTAKTRGPRWLHRLEASPLTWLLTKLVARASRLERSKTGGALSARAEMGLRSYLQIPLHDQITSEYASVPPAVSFVFGHTHKPFVGTQAIDGYPAAINIYNTGGWVVDTIEPNLLQGGAAVLIDESLDVLLLRVYNQTADDSFRVHVERSQTEVPSPFADKISSLVNPEDSIWLSLSTTASQLVAERHRALSSILGS